MPYIERDGNYYTFQNLQSPILVGEYDYGYLLVLKLTFADGWYSNDLVLWNGWIPYRIIGEINSDDFY